MTYFETDERKYIPYTYWRRKIAPWRSEYKHEGLYPTFKEYQDYRYLAFADGYLPFGSECNDEYKCWINLLRCLRNQFGERKLTPQEEKDSLDKGVMIVYT